MEDKTNVVLCPCVKGEYCSIHSTEHDKKVYKAGIREVVEWIKENKETPLGTDHYGYYIWDNKLKAKLKKWGL